MGNLGVSIVREVIQKLVGAAVLYVVAWLATKGLTVPETVETAVREWGVIALVAVGVTVWTAVVRFLETRQGRFARGLAQLLMLGVRLKPSYPAVPSTPVQPAGDDEAAVRRAAATRHWSA